jgi:hypothetical protein
MNPERIFGPAILVEGAQIPVVLPPPMRHHHVLQHMKALGFTREQIFSADQGFATDRQRFLNRKEAWHVAEAAGQIVRRDLVVPNGLLFSEHMW